MHYLNYSSYSTSPGTSYHRQPPPKHQLPIYKLFTNYIWSISTCIILSRVGGGGWGRWGWMGWLGEEIASSKANLCSAELG